jgi:hypothetical protein
MGEASDDKSVQNTDELTGRARSLANLRSPWKPGESGNVKGRPSAGAALREWGNILGEAELTEQELRDIAGDPKAPMLKRAAADRMLRLYMPPLSRYEPLTTGDKTLEEMESAGVDTAAIKKIKTRQEYDKDGKLVATTRELELHNLAGDEYDRLCEQTAGKPEQPITGNLGIPTSITMNVLGPTR